MTIDSLSLDNLAGHMDSQKKYHLVFFGHPYYDANGQIYSQQHCFNVLPGEVVGAIRKVMSQGGIMSLPQDGKLVFTPWPFASIEIREGVIAPANQ